VCAAREGKLAEVGKGQRLPSELELELARTRKELADAKMERDLLKKFATYFAKEYGRIDELRQQYPVAAMCRVLDVSESGYHAWRKRPLSPRAQANARLEVEIRAAHERTRQTYGPKRLQADLVESPRVSRRPFGLSQAVTACSV
jgi:putative transposase